jgi:FkbM family methyltransferase
MGGLLVYDVGVNDGADSAYYLARGYKVVGIEANPVLAASLRARFTDAIASGAYVLLDVGVGDTYGEAEFWISDNSEWSSFSRNLASRDGAGCRPVIVQTRPFDSILEQFGRAHFCKIDIEGYDRLCLESMSRDLSPEYISIEMSHKDAIEDFKLLRQLGFSKFKIISQVTRSQASPLLMYFAYWLPWRVAVLLRAANRKLRGVDRLDGWCFEQNSSGSFAEDTPGAWKSYDSAVRRWQFLKKMEQRFETKGLHDWFDIHAAQ